MKDHVERVLVVKSDWIHGLQSERGFISDIHPDFFDQLVNEVFFMDRPDAEADPSFRQVIPYVLVNHDGKYLTVTRLATQGEARLHNKMSFGIGGHINPIDETDGFFLDEAMKRELSEELETDDPPGWNDLTPVGLICSDYDEVSRVHLGIVFVWNSPEPVTIRETDKMHGEYLTPDDIGTNRDRLENWSRLVYDGLVLHSGKHT